MSTKRVWLVILIASVLLLAAGAGIGQARPPVQEPTPLARTVPDRELPADGVGQTSPGSHASGGPLHWWWFPISQVSATYTVSQLNPAAAYNSQRQEYLVVWQDEWSPGPTKEVRGQRVSRTGALVGSSFLISPYGGYSPDVAYNSKQNEYLVVWETSGGHIRGRRVSATGALQGSEIAIATGYDMGAYHYERPAVAYAHTADKYLVTFQHTWDPTGSQQIQARAYLSDGTAENYIFAVSSSSATTLPEKAALAYNRARDEFLIVWQELSGSQHDIYGRRVDMVGGASAWGSSFPILAMVYDETNPSVAAIPHPLLVGQYLVVCDRLIGTYRHIRAQRVTGTGSLEGSYIALSSESNQETEPAVASCESSKTYLVVWKYEHMDDSIRAREVSTEGVMGTSTLLFAWYADNPALASGPVGDFLITTDDELMATGWWDIYGKFWGNRVFLPLIVR